MKVITTRVPEKYFEDLREIERELQAERAEVVRRLLAEAIKQWKMKKVLELLREHKITLRKAASIAEVSYVEILDLASEAGIDIGYTLSDLYKDMENL